MYLPYVERELRGGGGGVKTQPTKILWGLAEFYVPYDVQYYGDHCLAKWPSPYLTLVNVVMGSEK